MGMPIISSIAAEESANAYILNIESEELMTINHLVKTAVDTVYNLLD